MHHLKSKVPTSPQKVTEKQEFVLRTDSVWDQSGAVGIPARLLNSPVLVKAICFVSPTFIVNW